MRLLEVEEGRRPAARTAPSVQPDPSRAPGRLHCTAPYPSASLPASQLPNNRWVLDQSVQFWAAPGSQGGKLGLVGSVPLGLTWLWEYQAGPTEPRPMTPSPREEGPAASCQQPVPSTGRHVARAYPGAELDRASVRKTGVTSRSGREESWLLIFIQSHCPDRVSMI